MIFVDANILLYAENQLDPMHERAKSWWERTLSGESNVCLTWLVLTAFIRISTNPRIFSHPLTAAQAIERVEGWFQQPIVRVISPTAAHWDVFADLLRVGQATANLVSDAHLAAIVIEHGGALYSTDADFSRFPKLKWRNPLRA